MVMYIKTDIFTSNADALVNPVNCVGVMGKGLAEQFKHKYPTMYQEYRELCFSGKLSPGMLHVYRSNKAIINFPTKLHWRNPSKLEYIGKGLDAFLSSYRDYNIQSVSFPMLGCGYGGLSWLIVRPLMERYLNNVSIDVYIHTL